MIGAALMFIIVSAHQSKTPQMFQFTVAHIGEPPNVQIPQAATSKYVLCVDNQLLL